MKISFRNCASCAVLFFCGLVISSATRLFKVCIFTVNNILHLKVTAVV